MTIEQIKKFAEVMIATAKGDGKLETHERVAVVIAAIGACGRPE